MKKNIFMFVFLIIFSINSHAENAEDLLNSINVLDQTVNNGLEKADNILSDQQRELFINISNYTAYLLGNLKDLSNNLDRSLTKKENAILNDINTVTKRIDNTSSTLSNKADDIGAIIANAPTRIFGSDKYPTPLFYSIPIITNSQNKNIDIVIKGVRLKNPKNYIVFSGKTIPVTSIASDQEISFTIPLTNNDLFTPNSINTFKVVLYEDRFILKDREHIYTPRFVVAPTDVAAITVFYKVPTEIRETSKMYSDIVHATSGSSKTKDIHKTFRIINSAGDGWKLDRATVKCWKSKGSGSKHGYGGPYKNTFTDTSFVAKAYAKKGKATCTCTWKEFRIVKNEEIKTSTDDLKFSSQKVISLPKNLIGLQKVVVKYYDGSTYETSDTYFKHNYLEFNFKLLKNLYEIKFSSL